MILTMHHPDHGDVRVEGIFIWQYESLKRKFEGDGYVETDGSGRKQSRAPRRTRRGRKAAG